MACDLKSFDIKKIKYEINIGGKDRNIRFIVGATALAASVFMGSIALLVIGGLLVVSGFTRWCPAYSAFQHNTLEGEGEAGGCGGCCHHHEEAAAPAEEAVAPEAAPAEAEAAAPEAVAAPAEAEASAPVADSEAK